MPSEAMHKQIRRHRAKLTRLNKEQRYFMLKVMVFHTLISSQFHFGFILFTKNLVADIFLSHHKTINTKLFETIS